jgi:hypothetical protein
MTTRFRQNVGLGAFLGHASRSWRDVPHTRAEERADQVLVARSRPSIRPFMRVFGRARRGAPWHAASAWPEHPRARPSSRARKTLLGFLGTRAPPPHRNCFT